MQIRLTVPQDAPAIATIHVTAWQAAYKGLMPAEVLDKLSVSKRTTMWEQSMTSPRSSTIIYLAEDGGDAVGFVAGGPPQTEVKDYRAEVYALYILPGHWRKGLGRQLMQVMVSSFQDNNKTSMVIWVLKDNLPACSFYTALGGHVTAEKQYKVGTEMMDATGYGWEDFSTLLKK
jgi:ribosomal protein S18 acetylase RimI-like enzyme